MKNNTKNLFLGVASSLLLAAGLTRAADRLDPMSQILGHNTDAIATAAAESCSEPCTSGCNLLDESSNR